MFAEFVNLNLIWFGALSVVSTLLILSFLQSSVAGARMVSALEMPMLQRQGKSVIIDVNKSPDFADGHIPNSINIPLEDLRSDDKSLVKHKDRTAIIVCQTGARSRKAAKQLIDFGFSNVNVLRGGLISWTKENLPISRNNSN